MVVIYLGSGFKTMKRMEELKNFLDLQLDQDQFKIVIPQLVNEYIDHEYVFSDLYWLDKSDILIVYIPEDNPSIGASMELCYFKTKYPNKLAIAYDCADHGWIRHFSDIRVDNKDKIRDMILNYQMSHSI